jgi:hypothetical protein
MIFIRRAFAHLAFGLLLAIAAAQNQALADVQTVHVVSVGGQSTNMFVVFSSNVGTDQACAGPRLILPAGVMDTESQKRFYAALLMAFATGTPVTISISGCYGSYPSMISTDFWFVPQVG